MDELDFGSQNEWYENYYSQLSCGDKAGFVAKQTHKSLERFNFQPTHLSTNVLEVGTGTGMHLHFIQNRFQSYTATDISERQIELAKLEFSDDPRNIEFLVADAEQLQFNDSTFDRVISTCVLLHLSNPEKALLEWRRVAKNAGVISIYVPAEPELLLRLGRLLITGRKAKKLGYRGYQLLMAREHINSAWALEQKIKYIFRNDSIKTTRWPFSRAPFFLTIYTVYQVKIDKIII